MREPGFYWVKKSSRFTALYNGWSVCEYASSMKPATDTKHWYVDQTLVDDSFWDEIDELRIVREEATKKELIEQLTNSIKNELRERISRDNHIFE